MRGLNQNLPVACVKRKSAKDGKVRKERTGMRVTTLNREACLNPMASGQLQLFFWGRKFPSPKPSIGKPAESGRCVDPHLQV
jgi:hypothetical protein